MCTKLLVLNFREPKWRSDGEKPVPARVKPELVEMSEFYESQETIEQSRRPQQSGTGGSRKSIEIVGHLLKKLDCLSEELYRTVSGENGCELSVGGGEEGGR